MEEKESKPFTVQVDRDMCQTAATCLAYQVYELDDEEKAVLLTKNGLNSDDPGNPLTTPDGTVSITDLANDTGRTPEETQELVMESAIDCPFNAIIVKDEDGNQLWPLL